MTPKAGRRGQGQRLEAGKPSGIGESRTWTVNARRRKRRQKISPLEHPAGPPVAPVKVSGLTRRLREKSTQPMEHSVHLFKEMGFRTAKVLSQFQETPKSTQNPKSGNARISQLKKSQGQFKGKRKD